jgi:hypothetical protein
MDPADYKDIVELGRDIHKESCYHILDYDTDKFLSFLMGIQQNKSMLAMVAFSEEKLVGIIIATCYQPYFSNDTVSSDVLTYVAAEHRGSLAFFKLVACYIAWAKSNNARMIFLQTSTGINFDKTAKLYRRLGARQIGNNFVMEA